MTTITAAAPHFLGEGNIEVREHDYRDPGPGEMRIQIHANAVCGTDRHEYFEGSPIVPGHEAAGVVESVGDGVETLVGTRGAIYLMDFCGQCRACRIGATNQCHDKRQDVGQSSDGGYGPFAIVHESHFFPVTDDVSLVHATLLLDVMGTSAHALRRAELVREDIESILISGAGPIGLGLASMARLRWGADLPIYITDLSPWRRDFAETLGVIAVDPKDEGRVRALAPDVAFDSTGRTSARELALRSLSKRGALICVGHGEGLGIDVSRDLIAPERAVLGSEYFRFDEMTENLTTLRAHPEELAKIITHQLPIDRLTEAFDLFLNGRTGKVVVTQGGTS